MIQRIQTVYLLAVVVLQSILFFSGQAISADESVVVGNVLKLSSNLNWAILILATTIIPLITIFLFKKRKLQVRISIINSVLLLCLQGVVFFFVVKFGAKFENVNYSPTVVSPIISLIFTILAIRFILKDEIKVRALDRIR